MKRYLYLILTLMLLSACADDPHVIDCLDRAEALMGDCPDSAYTLLTDCDSLITHQSKSTRMRHLMLTAEAENKLYLPMPSDTLFQQVTDYYDHHGTPNQQLKAHYLLGCIYRDMKEAPQAIECYYDAVEKADTLSDDCDYTTLYKVYGQMADILHSQIMPQEEIEALKQYSKYALKAGNVYEYIQGSKYMAEAFDLMGDTTNVLLVESQAHDLFLKHGFPKDAAGAYTNSLYVYLARGDYEKTRQMMCIFERESGLFDSEGNIQKGREHYYYCKGLYYLKVNQPDSADFCFKKLLYYGYSFDAYRGLMEAALKKRDTTSMFFYSKLYEKAFDTLVTNIHAEASRQTLGMYNYTRSQKIAMEKTLESERTQNLLYIIAIITVIIISTLFHLHRRFKMKKQKEINSLNQNYTTALTNYEKAKEELSIMEGGFTLYKQKKQAELAELQTEVSTFQKEYGSLKQKEKFEALIQSHILDIFREKLIPGKGNFSITEKAWQELQLQLKQCLPLFYLRITENNVLSSHELHVTILTRLGFQTGAIAIILDTTKQHIANARASANKKLFADPSARTFQKNLSKI